MVRVCRPKRSWTEKNELWDRWRRGESQREIARALHRVSSCAYNVVAAEGGHRAAVPASGGADAERRRARRDLRHLAQGRSFRAISRRLRRAPSTISREVARNGGCGWYRAAPADRRAWRHAQRPQRCRLTRSPEAAARGGGKADAPVVSAANRRLAAADVSERS